MTAKRATVVIAVAMISAPFRAEAGGYSYEYVQFYSTAPAATCPGPNANAWGCTGFSDICNTKADAEGFGSVLNAAGYALDNGNAWGNTDVWNTDDMDPSLSPFTGEDNLWTDTANCKIHYISAHGSCNNRIDTTKFCNTNADCANPNQRCWTDNNSHRCANKLTSGDMATCSPNDSGPHAALINTQMCIGENPLAAWKGCGQNGGCAIYSFGTSCPFQMGWLIESGSNLFAGLHIVTGTSPYGSPWPSTTIGDIADSATVGTHYATRLKNGSTVAAAWLNTFSQDEPGSLLKPACAIAMACSINQTQAENRINNEKFIDGWASESGPPTWCSYVNWCRF